MCVAPQPGLDGKYPVFGSITEGLGGSGTDRQGSRQRARFLTNPCIVSVKIERKKPAPFDDVPVNDLKRTVTMKTTLGR